MLPLEIQVKKKVKKKTILFETKRVIGRMGPNVYQR